MQIKASIILGTALLSACSTVLAPKAIVRGQDYITIHTYYTRAGSEGEAKAAQIAVDHCEKKGFAKAEHTVREDYAPGTISHKFSCT